MTEEFDLFTSERLLSTHSSLMDFIMTCKKKKGGEKYPSITMSQKLSIVNIFQLKLGSILKVALLKFLLFSKQEAFIFAG